MSEERLESPTAGARGETDPVVGSFDYDPTSGRWTWSADVFRIHGFEPHDVVPTTELIRFHVHADDRDAVTKTLTNAMECPGPFCVLFRLIDAGGTTRLVLVIGNASTHPDGRAVLHGQFVDLTRVHDQMLHEDLVPLVDDFREHRAVIEQAKGILIQILCVNADQAFDILCAYSRMANIKVRDLAERLVAAAAQDLTPTKGTPGLTLADVFDVLSTVGGAADG